MDQIIHPLTLRNGETLEYSAPGRVINRVFDQCQRGLIPVAFTHAGPDSIHPVNVPVGQLWAESTDNKPLVG